jgi:hypothetical protein
MVLADAGLRDEDAKRVEAKAKLSWHPSVGGAYTSSDNAREDLVAKKCSDGCSEWAEACELAFEPCIGCRWRNARALNS